MDNVTFVFNYYKYPIVPVKFYYNGKETPFIDALLDSGGDFIVIPLPIAKYLGLKLKKAGSVDTAGGTTLLYKAVLSMVIGSKEKSVTYSDIQIHVSGREDIPVLLGRHPIFEDYEIIFRKKENQLILKSITP
ncbi:MAG: aspartyl protease [Thermoplasmata archaeon]|nr:MAG: aspartyl protease [Thermoplasmata archaeon]RLF34423.1 MAG: aspartyl protease [Thermoplasmata archaeon]RLF52180.1 MAG: aspartyl protease [Thermoplasmata archaeon]